MIKREHEAENLDKQLFTIDKVNSKMLHTYQLLARTKNNIQTIKTKKKRREKYLTADKQRSSIHGFACVIQLSEKEKEERERERGVARRIRTAAQADSKQSNQSWLNELLIISRIRQSGEGNCPYNGGAKCARPTVCKCGERVDDRGMEERLVVRGAIR